MFIEWSLNKKMLKYGDNVNKVYTVPGCYSQGSTQISRTSISIT